MSVRLLFVHALSPLHAGTGQSVGAIELAIARDRATGMPYLPGSSIKGPLRARSDELKLTTEKVFGPKTDKASDHAGALVFGDANLLLLPVRSVHGTFAWATSPYLLARFARDCSELKPAQLPPAVAGPAGVGVCSVAPNSSLRTVANGKVIFEDLDLGSSDSNEVGTLAKFIGERLFPDAADASWRDMLKSRLCVVHDQVLSYLAEHATDVVARVALKPDSKTVDNLWHEESLPTESVLISMVLATPNGKTGLTEKQLFDALKSVTDKSIQLGGKATVGRGRCRLVVAGGGGK